MAQEYKDIIKSTLFRCKRAFWYTVWFSLAMNVLMLFLPFFSLQVFDKVLSSHSMETLVMLTGITVFAFIVLSIFNALRTFVLNRMADWVEANLSPKLFEVCVARAAMQPGAGSTQILRDLSTIKVFITGNGMQTLLDAPWAPIFIITTFFIHPMMGVITLAGCIILLGLAVLNEAQTKKKLEDTNHSMIAAFRNADNTVRNSEAIEAMGMLDQVVERWQTSTMAIINQQKVALDRSAVIGSISKFFRLGVQLALVCAGAYFAINHSLSMGAMIAGPILAGRALAPFEAAIGTWKPLVTARDAYKRINETVARTQNMRSDMSMPAPRGVLTVEGVYYRPPNSDRMVLGNVNLRLEPGESLGVIGPSAAGKSTLAKMIVGVWQPSNGAVRLDGVDVFKWDRVDAGQYIGYMPQSVELFPVSVRDNIARLMPDVSDEEIVAAARLAGVHEMIVRLPKGYDTMVGDGTVSPGQQQRVALARALFRNPRLLVLDEPNSNLDGEGEMALSMALNGAKRQGITAVVIAHKPSIVAAVDKLLVLRDGQVDLFGPREAVIAKLAERQQPKKAVEAAGA